ncbi:MAG TPA: hypothetical protein VFG69_07005 [Nannocystaceae bacterium]|nr:hypothetical protein [Nannocystaceae bacterium]
MIAIVIGLVLVLAGGPEGPREFAGVGAVAADPASVEPEIGAPTTTTTTTTTTTITPTTTTTTTPTPTPTPTTTTPGITGGIAGAGDRGKARRKWWREYQRPRLVLGGGPVVGPHSFGNEECRQQLGRCETKGTFFGIGGQVELRGQLWKPLYLHARVLAVGNASPAGRDPVHAGLWGLGIGVGAYSKRAFVRGEYLFVDTFGGDRFALPFGDQSVGRDRWGHHAGLFSVGLRLPFQERYGAELWGGFMAGPRSRREIPGQPLERRVLLTFLVGLNVTYDLIPAKGFRSRTPASPKKT